MFWNNKVHRGKLGRKPMTDPTPTPPWADGDNVTIKPERGNSRAYTLDRLRRERPDLFERVKAGEFSANAAAIEAGFRKRATPLERIKREIAKLDKKELAELFKWLWTYSKGRF
jgi:hypothetical protein